MSQISSFSRQETKIQTNAHKTAGDGAQFFGQTEQVAPFATADAGNTKSSAGTRGTRKYPGEEGLKSATEHKTKHRAQNVKHGRQSFLRPAVTTFKVRLRGRSENTVRKLPLGTGCGVNTIVSGGLEHKSLEANRNGEVHPSTGGERAWTVACGVHRRSNC